MIRLRFVQGTGWVSSAISLFSAGHLSHVDAILPDGNLYGARSDSIGHPPNIPSDFDWSGVRERPYPYEKVAVFRIFQINATIEQEATFYGFLKEQDGKPYDHLAIVAFGFGRDWRNQSAWFCSELIAAALEAAGILSGNLLLSVNKITPVMLATLVSNLPNATEVAGR